MTRDQKVTLSVLETVVYAPRQRGRIDAIKQAFQDYKKTLEPVVVPWWKRIFRFKKR